MQPFIKKIQITLDYLLSKIKGIEKEIDTLSSTINNISGGSGVSEIIIGRTLVVSEEGNDALALAAGKYDLSQHWANPTVAMSNAIAGDTVLVLTGRYRIGVGESVVDDGNQQMVKDGVILYMMPGAVIHYTNLTGTASLPFTDASGAGQFIIRGNGTFIFNRNISGGDSFLVTTNVNSVVDWEFDEIDIRRRWGGTGYNAKSWRMVGRKYQNRESMIFAFRNTSATTDRFVDIDIEDVVIGSENANNQWTRQELRSFGAGSICNIRYGKVVYPNAFNIGGFHQNTSCTTGSIINLFIGSINRLGTVNVRDYIIRNVSSFHGGVTELNNISTQTGIELTSGSGGNSNTSRLSIYNGKVRSGHVGSGNITTVAVNETQDSVVVKLNIVVESTYANYVGMIAFSSPNVIFTGKVLWKNATNEPVRLSGQYAIHGVLRDLVLSITTSVDSIINTNAVSVNARIINVYATNAVSTANGGIVQQIDTVTVDSNI